MKKSLLSKIIFTRAKFASVILLFGVSGFIAAPKIASADIVVREADVSDTEFQALAKAIGHTPISDYIVQNLDVVLSKEASELFQLRLVDAQTEWIKVKNDRVKDVGPNLVTTAIDTFLDLESRADWPKSERQAFLKFKERKNELIKNEKKSSSQRPETPNIVSFPSALPLDVTFILIDGRPVRRDQIKDVRLPGRSARLTLLSDLFQPSSVTLHGDESDWPLLERARWINADCSKAELPGELRELNFSVLGVGRCSSNTVSTPATKTSASGTSEKVFAKFGLEKSKFDGSNEALLFGSSKMERPLIERPWFWGVVGAVAIGAFVAIDQSQKRSSDVRPTTTVSW